ncbi:MAG: hypothetical protein ACLTH3_13895 [Lachnospira sp.]
MLISFAVVFAVFFAGLAVFKSRNNYCTLIAAVLVLPAAKFCSRLLCITFRIKVQHRHRKKPWKLLQERLPAVTTAFFQTAKVRLVHRQLLSQTMPSARSTQEEKADKTLFETSLRDFLKNEKLAANVTLYTDEKTFLNRVRGLAANFDDTDKRSMDRMEWITHAMKNMCL